ncbi:CheR family methyltransferase [Maridesulfovibrio frigidus]|uniref:CheR family methyltransferase n=1 Tax=Maridesulfovibrio frigidus TaxID=340956 RepID=UPI0004E218FA|nr:CheR family methyltransferase [Maridesulfovibrio frigidus]
MPESLSDEKIDLLSQMVREIYGLKFLRDRWNDLRSAVVYAASKIGRFESSEQCLDYLLSPNVGEKELELFINQLTIGETYFFRDPDTLKALELEVLRNMNGKGSGNGGAVRIWSMACATGEEPYTLAMMCHRSHILSEILGTDIDSEALSKAREGCYRKWAFRVESNNFQEVYFKPNCPQSFNLDNAIKAKANFSRFNLIGDELPLFLMSMDVLLCRNVLIYFSEVAVEQVLDKIWTSLNYGGWLVVTPSESGLITAYGKFEPVNFGSVLLFRKTKGYTPKKFNEALNSIYTDDFNQNSDFSNSDLGVYPDLSDNIDFIADNYLVCETDSSLLCDTYDSYSTPESESANDLTENADNSSVLNPVEAACELRAQGDNLGALSLLKKSLDENLPQSTKAEVLSVIAGIKADSGLLGEAVHWCEKSIEADRVAPDPHFLLGQIRMNQGDFDSALSELRKAVYLDSSFVMAHFALGNIYLSKQDKGSALRHFRIALQELKKIDKDYPVPHSDGTAAGRCIEMIELVKNNIG